MDARNTVQRIVAILVIAVGGAGGLFPVFAHPVYTYGGDFDLRIPDEPDNTKGSMDEAIIQIKDHHIISDLDVRISITHTNVFDLQISLESPAGTSLFLNMYNLDEFFIDPNYTQTIFDDEAEVPIEQAEPPFTGRFRPVEPYKLSLFDGRQAYGIWRLQIYDMWPADTGTLDSFELTITTTPEPATAIFLILGVGLVTLFRSRRDR